jgi:DNA-binding Lrp family transcriptional regulator
LTVRAYILIQTEQGKAIHVAEAIVGIDGVISASAVNGPYGVIALTEAANVGDLGQIVLGKVQMVEGIGPLLIHAGVDVDPDGSASVFKTIADPDVFPRPIDPPIPYRGRPGLWAPPAAVVQALREIL